MEITNIKKADYCDSDFILDSTIRVTFDSGDVVDVQLAGGDYKPSLGCLVFLNGEEPEDDEDDEDDEEKFGLFAMAIEAAEEYAHNEHAQTESDEVDLGFNCSIGNSSQYIIVDNYSDEAHIISRNHYNDDYSSKISILKSFDNIDDAVEYVDSFKTGKHVDFDGLQAMLDDIQRN